MQMEIIKEWEKKKRRLEEYFRNTRQEKYSTYLDIVKIIVKVILPGYDYKKITVIDDGDWQGTQIFIIPSDVYQPDIEEYLYTYVYYGSCSGCDTLLGINNYEDGKPNDSQIKDYITLCLHLIQRMKPFVNKE